MQGDEDFYGFAAREIEARAYDHSLMAKAFALALGDKPKTEALYIRLRVEQLKTEATQIIADAVAEGVSRKAKEDEARKARQNQIEADRKRAAEQARRSAEIEAQMVGDFWNRGTPSFRPSDDSVSESSASKPSTPPQKPSPPMTDAERERIIESLKKELNKKPGFL